MLGVIYIYIFFSFLKVLDVIKKIEARMCFLGVIDIF